MELSDPHQPEGPASPVLQTPPDEAPKLKPGIALCLSGGGYRAMLFHLGALWRLNEVGYLPKLQQVSSVSGGSITAAYLGLKWNSLNFDEKGVALSFESECVAGIRDVSRETIDVRSAVSK